MKRPWKRNLRKFSLIGGLVVLLVLIGAYSALANISQPPSQFPIETDGFFTSDDEWSDVTPAERLNGAIFVYTAVAPGCHLIICPGGDDLEDLYLMYDFVGSEAPLSPGETVGPVHFHNGGNFFEVFFVIGGGVEVWVNGILVTNNGIEEIIEGAHTFGTSPNSNTPHNMFELEVKLIETLPIETYFEGQKSIGAIHGELTYHLDPSHWGASLPTGPGAGQGQPSPDEDCEDRSPQGVFGGTASQTSGFPIPHSSQNGFVSVVVSNACVDVQEDGSVEIVLIPIPEEELVDVDIDIKPGSDPNSINPKSMGLVPVAILGSDTLDVTTIDVTTLAFGPDAASPAHDLTDPVVHLEHLEDVNDDGFDDLVSHYRQKETGIASGDDEACLRGKLVIFTPFQGCDSVRVK